MKCRTKRSSLDETIMLYQILFNANRRNSSITHSLSHLSKEQQMMKGAIQIIRDILGKWFSTFLSLRHSNFEKKFDGTPKC